VVFKIIVISILFQNIIWSSQCRANDTGSMSDNEMSEYKTGAFCKNIYVHCFSLFNASQ
jgi:hypothetical protein